MMPRQVFKPIIKALKLRVNFLVFIRAQNGIFISQRNCAWKNPRKNTHEVIIK